MVLNGVQYVYIYRVLLIYQSVNIQLDKYDAAVVKDRVSHLCETRICYKNSCKFCNRNINSTFSWVETSNMMAQDTAESSLMTLTERGQNKLKLKVKVK